MELATRGVLHDVEHDVIIDPLVLLAALDPTSEHVLQPALFPPLRSPVCSGSKRSREGFSGLAESGLEVSAMMCEQQTRSEERLSRILGYAKIFPRVVTGHDVTERIALLLLLRLNRMPHRSA